MSSQRGNVSRSRTQKYQNARAFKNDMHDTSKMTKVIKGLSHEGVCQPCKDKLEWKIKYKKYKPLTQPATCIRCHNKCVKRAYLIVCQPCAEKAEICAKCNQKKKIALPVQPSAEEAMAEEEMSRFELMQLPERKRRTVLRYMEKGQGACVSERSTKDKEIAIGDEQNISDEGDQDDSDVETDPKDLNEFSRDDGS